MGAYGFVIILVILIYFYRYNVYEMGDPYLTYTVNVTVQQLNYKTKQKNDKKTMNVWSTVGFAEIGPKRMGQNTNANHVGKESSPKVETNEY